MLAQTLVPFKFLFAMTEIVTASLMLATESVFPTENSTTSDRYIFYEEIVSLLGAP